MDYSKRTIFYIRVYKTDTANNTGVATSYNFL